MCPSYRALNCAYGPCRSGEICRIQFMARKMHYSKALRCTFFWKRKKSCSSKFVQLLLLNRVKARCSENRAAQGFYFINSFISNFFGPHSKTCTCKVRATQGRVSRGLTVICSNASMCHALFQVHTDRFW